MRTYTTLETRYPRATSALIPVVLAGALIGGAWLPIAPLRVAIVLPILLYVPGSFLDRLAFGRRGTLPLARVVLNVVLSIAVLALIGVVLSAVSLLLTRTSVALSIGLLIAVIGTLAVLREKSDAKAYGAAVAVPPRPTISRQHVLGVIGIVAAIGGSTGLAIAVRHLPPAPPLQPFESLYLAGDSSKVQQPITYTNGAPLTLTVGLANDAAETRNYELAEMIKRKVVPYRHVQVGAGSSWEGTLSGVPPTDGCLDRLSIVAVPLDASGKQLPNEAISVGVWLQPLVDGPHCPKQPRVTSGL